MTDMRCEAQRPAVCGFEGSTVFANRNGPALGVLSSSSKPIGVEHSS